MLLAAYAHWGRECVRKFRGMFAFALWDTEAKSLFLARDRCGEKPLYYSQNGKRLVFASELKALLKLAPECRELDARAVDEFLHYQYAVEPRTLLREVRKLPQATQALVSGAEWKIKPVPYWDLELIPASNRNPAEAVREALDESIALTLRSDVPVGVALSGGLDSSCIAALAARKYASTLNAFCIGYPGRPENDERSQAEALARKLGIAFHEIELSTDQFADFFPQLVDMMDDPIADVAAYGHYYVTRLARDHGVKVLLTGIGGDELFFGYSWIRESIRLTRLKQSLQAAARGKVEGWRKWVGAICANPWVPRLIQNRRLPAAWKRLVEPCFDLAKMDLAHPHEAVFYQLDYHWNPAVAWTRQCYSDEFKERLMDRSAQRNFLLREMPAGLPIYVMRMLFDTWLASNCLALGDRVSMASGVETRLPLLDSKLIETVTGLVRGHGIGATQQHKRWLSDAVADVLPPEVLKRPKRGFATPTVPWMQAVNRRYRGLLNGGAAVEQGIFDQGEVERVIAEESRGVQRDFFVYKMVLLEIWLRRFVRGESIE